jgi:hypothetical protein
MALIARACRPNFPQARTPESTLQIINLLQIKLLSRQMPMLPRV